MRPSPQRHTVAVLRQIIGLGQKELAELVECSRPTIQAVELGKLKLSDKLASRIARETGISLKWLMDDNVNAPPVERDGDPYSRQVFERVQSNVLFQDAGVVDGLVRMSLVLNTSRIAAILLAAYKRGKFPLCSYKLGKALEELSDEFGAPSHGFGLPIALEAQSHKKIDLQRIADAFNTALNASTTPRIKPTRKRSN